MYKIVLKEIEEENGNRKPTELEKVQWKIKQKSLKIVSSKTILNS